MRIKVSIIAIVIIAAAITTLPARAITWGEPDTTHFNVGAMVVDWPDYGPWQWCTGTLIHPQVFLTAGHCTDGLEEYGIEQVWVNFDISAVTPDTLLPVKEVITHPSYSWGGSDPHDIGLLILEEPVIGINPAPLPEVGYLNELKKAGELRTSPSGAKFTMVGYGGSLSWPPPEIYYEDLRQVAYSEYIALTQPFLHLSQNLNKGDGGTCFGDSGGPAFWTTPDGQEIVVAVVSWGDAMCVTTGFNYRVDTVDSMNFIEEVIASVEEGE